MATLNDPFGAVAKLSSKAGNVTIYRLNRLAEAGLGDIASLPFSIKVLLESCLRNLDNFQVTEKDVRGLAAWDAKSVSRGELPFKPARVILQDFTGVPAVVDLAAMRSAMKRAGGDPQKINPLVPVDLVIDHSVQVDEFGSAAALGFNVHKEFERNRERYEFLKWGQKAFHNFSVVPPATGIVHQVNLEYLAKVVMVKDGVALPDSLVGTDSHTTMINGLGVVGWGVGGIEAEACMLGQPIYMVTPPVVGFKLKGALPEGATATDLVLVITQILRSHGVVEKFVEFHGEGLENMTVADRATIANMAPEYGATMGFFPVDNQTLDYLRLTGREAAHIDLVERYAKEQGLWRSSKVSPKFTEELELDLATVNPSVAGPRRPQDRMELRGVKQAFESALVDVFKKSVGQSVTPRLDRWSAEAPVSTTQAKMQQAENRGDDEAAVAEVEKAEEGKEAATTEHLKSKKDTAIAAMEDQWVKLTHGDVVIAAITSCTNTSNPSVMIAAGLVAKKAVEKGLSVKPYVKTSLSPGSRVVTDYFNKAGLTPYLDQLGFQTTGYGCMTCIGNSGPLPDAIANAVEKSDLVVSAVLSGNRNFEGRINPHVKANYLASPPLVVAYAIAGTMDVNLMDEPLAKNKKGEAVYLRDIWPTQAEVASTMAKAISPDMFRKQYGNVAEGNPEWNKIPVKGGELFDFDDVSTYIQEPPFFTDLAAEPKPIRPIKGARVLVMVGDSVTTDHISPAGSIKKDSPAGRFLMDHDVQPLDFNSYGARRGNDRIMTRGTFANIRLKNLLAPGTEGGVTRYLGKPGEFGEEITSIYDASVKYQAAGIPLMVLAGKDYGMGSSRDWAAKGVYLLGVKAVIAESFERIHRSNLVGMGVLPLQFQRGQNRASLGLDGTGTYEIEVGADLRPLQELKVRVTNREGATQEFTAVCRIDTPVEIDYYRNGGILHTVLRNMLRKNL
ncbi:MAG TPA: aconitate hydratase [Tepidisphaeraceae bacterium]|jgi:aconitate hydratase|nr:aconitate hydratase [Tepidisphaeraceae bacterium]